MIVPAVNLEEAKKFSNVWTLGGLAIPLDHTALKFATDFANVVLKSFFVQAEAKLDAVVEAKVKERLDEEKNKLILEG